MFSSSNKYDWILFVTENILRDTRFLRIGGNRSHNFRFGNSVLMSNTGIKLTDSFFTNFIKCYFLLVPPSKILLKSGDVEVTELVTVTESQLSYMRCDTRYSNPAPSIRWTLGDQIIASNSYNQTDAPEKNIAQKVKWDGIEHFNIYSIQSRSTVLHG